METKTQPNIEMETLPSCILCGSKNLSEALEGRDYPTGGHNTFKIMKCKDCDFHFTNPRPTEASMGLFYPDDYSPYQENDVSREVSSSSVKKSVPSFFIPNLDYRGLNLLEVGCASGNFLTYLKKNLGARTTGVEYSQSAANKARARGLNILSPDEFEKLHAESSFDVIFAWMVVEHLYNPLDFFVKVKKLLKPGGYFVLSVPTIDSIETQLFKGSSFSLMLPTHLSHFSKKTMVRALEMKGLKVVQVSYQWNSANYWGSMQNFFQDHHCLRLAKFSGQIKAGQRLSKLKGLCDRIAGWTGTSGRLTVWAQK